MSHVQESTDGRVTGWVGMGLFAGIIFLIFVLVVHGRETQHVTR